MSRSKEDDAQSTVLDFWQLFRELPESYLLLKTDAPKFTIAELNQARERLTNIKRNDIIGRPFFEVYPDFSETFRHSGVSEIEERFRKVIRTNKPLRLKTFRYDIADDNGMVQQRYWQSRYVPLHFGSKRVTHILAMTRDVTEEHRTERRIANMEGRLEAALTIGKVGSWVWDMDSDVVIGDRNLARLFDIDPRLVTRGLPLEKFVQAIHPDDRDRVERAISRTIAERVSFDEEYRTVTASGKTHWVLARGKIEEQNGQSMFPGVIVDITERRDLQAQVELAHKQDQLNRRESRILQKRNEELETIGRTKDEFVALASHQLRTPATAVKQYLGMVLQGYVGEVTDIQSEMLHKAFESNERQIQIINQILNAARVDTGRLALTMMPVDLCSLARGVAEDLRATLEQHKHAFTIRIPDEPITISADTGYLRMAIENLLHNACLYTPDGGEISFAITDSNGQAEINITDNGVGIRKADIGRLFTKFSRIHNPLSVQAGGSGIGLYLTAEIVRLHDGMVTVDSQFKRGTTFAILLPVAQNKAEAKQTMSVSAKRQGVLRNMRTGLQR